MKGTIKTLGRLPSLAPLALLLGLVVACSAGSGPPAPDKYLGSYAQGGYLFLRWQEGLEVMIWYNLGRDVAHNAHSAGSAGSPVYTEHGSVQAGDGQIMTWTLQTADGQEGEMQLNGVSYDPSAGSLFIVANHQGRSEVRQLSRDLSAVPLDHEGILTWAGNDPDLAPLVPGEGQAGDSRLRARLAAPAHLLRGEPVPVEFTLTNSSAADLYVLKWYTPLEGIAGKIFRVLRDGQPVPYEGPLVSRAAPLPDEYVHLEAGNSVSTTVDLGPHYDFAQAGTYTISFLSPNISHVVQSVDEMATSVDELHPVSMPSNRVEITIDSP